MPCQIRWIDMDAYNHVNNTAYLRYLEEGRARLLAFERAGSADSGSPSSAQGCVDPRDVVIATVEIAYRRPLVFRLEPVEVRSTVTRTGRSSFDIAHEIRDADTVYATATSTLVMVDRGSGRSRPMSEAERAWLAHWSEDAPDDAAAPR